MQPRVRFTLTNNVGPVDIVSLGRVAIVFAGPTGDYTQLLNNGRFTIRGGGARPTLTPNGIGDYTYAPDAYVIPMSATGSWSVGMEARTNAIPVGSRTISFGSNNPVVHIDLTNGNLGGGSPVPRRLTVDQARCNVCHRDVIAHGNNRTDTTYCILCHNKWGTDEAQRPGVNPTTNPPETIDFKMMIHRIHTGDDLTGAYTVYGNGMSVHDFTEIRFPGDRRNCEKCHIPGTYLLPGPATAQATVVHIGGTPVPQVNAVRPPVTAACTGCHDSPDTFTHARLNSIVNSPTDWVESCNVCHGEGSAFAVSEVHKR
jgi:OmcA/MtrC family decaheme c-type cytochrome